MVNTHMAAQFLRYQLRALTRYELHSPYLYALEEAVLHDTRHYYAFDEIEYRRDLLLSDTSLLTVDDFGAGSHQFNTLQRRVADIAKSSLITPHFGQIMFRLVQFLQPQAILEMGTSLGISSSFMAKAAPNARLITLEGSPAIAEIALQQHKALQLENVSMLTGEFSQTLPEALNTLGKIDLAFIDGNHRKEPTLQYFDAIYPRLHEHAVMVFDDIHWSPGMDAAWKAILADKRVTFSIDLFYKGIVGFRPEFKEPRHIVLRY